MIEVEDLTKRYGDRTAVDGVSFQVHPGTVTGFLGPNGAGKPDTGLWHLCAWMPRASTTSTCARCCRADILAGQPTRVIASAGRRRAARQPPMAPASRPPAIPSTTATSTVPVVTGACR
jgi:ABC-type branched-subunit amino acid transport system ATPase component